MTLLDEALARADEEFFIFPLRENDKRPAVENWEQWATTDKEKIKTYWGVHPNANIGVACGPSKIVVLDVDNKKGKQGSVTILQIEKAKEDSTFTVETPTGGFHKYYEANGSELKNTAGKLGEGLDTRAKGGYVVAEGSLIGGKPYKFIGGDLPIKLPQWIIDGTSKRAEIVQTEEKSATPADMKRAVEYLTDTAPESIEGDGGDSTLYNVICELRDLGLSQAEAFNLTSALYNPRCVPEWHPHDIQGKIDNVFAYAQNSKGAKSFEGMFEDLTAPTKELHPIKASDISYMLPQRDWVLGHRLITGFVTVTVAPGGVGKSMYTMVEALAVATGRPLLGDTPKKTGAVVIYNTEDPLDEIQRRILAICIQYDIPLEELDNVYLLSGIDEPLRMATTVQGVTQVTQDNDKLIKLVEDTGAILLCVDPFIRTHSVQENDNNAIDTVVQCFSKLANQCRCSVSIVHHTRKLPAGTGAGDMDIARGASSLVSAARIATTLTVMGDKEAKSLQIPEHERYWYIRTDNAKGNMSAPAKCADWFKKVSVKLPNGDSVGTLEPVDLSANYLDKDLAARLEAENLVKELHATLGLGQFKLTEAVAVMVKMDFSGEAPATLRRKLMATYGIPVVVNGIKVAHIFREKCTPKHIIEISLA